MDSAHFYVERKHPCAWLMALCMIASAVLYITQPNGNEWLGAALPITAIVSYVLIAAFSGDEMLYRTAVPVWILGFCFAIQSKAALVWIASLLFCFCYAQIISGKAGKVWLLALYPAALAGCIYAGNIPASLTIAGMMVLWPAFGV